MITHETPLIEAHWKDIIPPKESIRRAVVANAIWAEGLSAGRPETKDLFRELLGPSWAGHEWDLDHPYRFISLPGGKYRTEGCSTCGLTASGILGRVVKLPWEGLPYQSGRGITSLDAVSRLTQLGFDWKCRLTPESGLRPKPGDILCIGSGLATHIRTVVKADGDAFESIDGGQVDMQHGGLQCVSRCKWTWTQNGKAAMSGKRQVIYWLDLDAMSSDREPWIVPEGWETFT